MYISWSGISFSHVAGVQVHVASPSFWLTFDLDMSMCTLGLTLMVLEVQGTQMYSEFLDGAFPQIGSWNPLHLFLSATGWSLSKDSYARLLSASITEYH